MFCVACDKFLTVAIFSFEDLDCQVVLKANRLIVTGEAIESNGAIIKLDSLSKIEINKALSNVIITENMDGEVVCPDCREGVLLAGEELVEPKETKEERLRREGFNAENPNTLSALTPEFIRKQIGDLNAQIEEEKALSKDNIITQFKIERYYISTDKGSTWKEVSLSSYASAERRAGLMPDPMKGPIASTSFNFEGVMGKVVKPKDIK